MIKRSELVRYLDQFLNSKVISDYAPNGLQVEGKDEIKRLCTAVTASYDAIEWAIDHKADCLLVHHGYFWKGEDPVISGVKRQRIAALLKHNLSLIAYHLPLDCHPELGNNACIAKLLGLTSVQKHSAGHTKDLLWSGKLALPMESSAFNQLLEKQFRQKPLLIEGHNRLISEVAFCSGGAQDYIVEASLLGADAYISGEVSERTYYLAKELGINYYACGHHATERYGIEALGNHLANEFGLEHTFFDSGNPI